jgi:hypothetical protein
METRKRNDGDMMLFTNGFDVFVLFFFIWDDEARMDIIGHWLNVRQRNCLAMGSRWNFQCGVEERKIVRKISGGMGNGFLGKGGFWVRIERREERGCRLNFWAITKVLKNPLHNVLQEA